MKKAPDIRVKGFSEDWEQRKLEKYIIEYHEVTTENNQYPILTSSRKGIFLQTEYFAGNQIASEDNKGYNIVPYGYFTYRHMSDDEIFHFNINDIVENGIVSTLYPVFTIDENIDSRYLQYQLNHGQEFAKFAVLQKQGGSRTYMYLNKLKKLSLTMPNTLSEQKDISSLFLNLDHLITLHQRKLEKLKLMKEAMLDKMFPKGDESVPKIRFKEFSDNWEQKELGELFSEYSEKNHPELPPLTIIQGQGTIKRSESNRIISYDDTSISGYKLVRENDFIVHLRSFEGGLEKANSDGIVSPAYHILHGDSIDPTFYYLFFRSYDFIFNRLKNCVYGIRDGKSIDIAEMKKIKIPYTSIEEQRKIGSYFSNLDRMILFHQQKHLKLKQFKESMLDKMFI